MNDRPLIQRSRFEPSARLTEGLSKAPPTFGQVEEDLLRFNRGTTFDNFDFPDVKTLDRERFLRVAGELVDTGSNAFLFGGAGTGKTHLGLALAKAAASKGKTVRFLDDRPDEELTEPSHMASDPAPLPRHDLVTCDLLVVDDIVHKDRAGGAAIARILLERFRAKRASVVGAIRKPEDLIHGDMLPLFDPSEPGVSDDRRDYLNGAPSLPFDRLRVLADMPADEVRAMWPRPHVWTRDELQKLSIWPRRNRTERLFLALNIGIHLPLDEAKALPVRDRILLPADIGAAAMYMALELAPLSWLPPELLPLLGAGQPDELRQWELFYLGQRNYRDHPKHYMGRDVRIPNPDVTAAWLQELGGDSYKPPVVVPSA